VCPCYEVVRAVFTSSVDVAGNWEASIVWSAASKRYNAAYLRTVPGIFYAEITLDANDGTGVLPLQMASSYDNTIIKAGVINTPSCTVTGRVLHSSTSRINLSVLADSRQTTQAII